MQYSTLLIIASALVASSYGATTSTSLQTVTNHQSTEVTITSCSNEACVTTSNSLVPSVATTTVEGVETVYTTYCPLSSEEAGEGTSAPTTTQPSTVAAESSEAPGPSSTETVVTTTVQGVETIYTTYCPLSSEEAGTGAPTTAAGESTPAAAGESTPAAASSAPAAAESNPSTLAGEATTPATESDQYVDVTETPTVSATENVEATETAQSTLFTSSAAGNSSSTEAGVSTYEAGAQRVAVGFAAVAGLAAALV